MSSTATYLPDEATCRATGPRPTCGVYHADEERLHDGSLYTAELEFEQILHARTTASICYAGGHFPAGFNSWVPREDVFPRREAGRQVAAIGSARD